MATANISVIFVNSRIPGERSHVLELQGQGVLPPCPVVAIDVINPNYPINTTPGTERVAYISRGLFRSGFAMQVVQMMDEVWTTREEHQPRTILVAIKRRYDDTGGQYDLILTGNLRCSMEEQKAVGEFLRSGGRYFHTNRIAFAPSLHECQGKDVLLWDAAVPEQLIQYLCNLPVRTIATVVRTKDDLRIGVETIWYRGRWVRQPGQRIEMPNPYAPGFMPGAMFHTGGYAQQPFPHTAGAAWMNQHIPPVFGPVQQPSPLQRYEHTAPCREIESLAIDELDHRAAMLLFSMRMAIYQVEVHADSGMSFEREGLLRWDDQLMLLRRQLEDVVKQKPIPVNRQVGLKETLRVAEFTLRRCWEQFTKHQMKDCPLGQNPVQTTTREPGSPVDSTTPEGDTPEPKMADFGRNPDLGRATDGITIHQFVDRSELLSGAGQLVEKLQNQLDALPVNLRRCLVEELNLLPLIQEAQDYLKKFGANLAPDADIPDDSEAARFANLDVAGFFGGPSPSTDQADPESDEDQQKE